MKLPAPELLGWGKPGKFVNLAGPGFSASTWRW